MTPKEVITHRLRTTTLGVGPTLWYILAGGITFSGLKLEDMKFIEKYSEKNF